VDGAAGELGSTPVLAAEEAEAVLAPPSLGSPPQATASTRTATATPEACTALFIAAFCREKALPGSISQDAKAKIALT
jgi:hypothetical protein